MVVGGKLVEDKDAVPQFFDQEKLDQLRERQLQAVHYLYDAFVRLFDSVPPNTSISVTADHGELFDEEEYFGYEPISHEKVYEISFVEGKIR